MMQARSLLVPKPKCSSMKLCRSNMAKEARTSKESSAWWNRFSRKVRSAILITRAFGTKQRRQPDADVAPQLSTTVA
jgi:hypothetical protein